MEISYLTSDRVGQTGLHLNCTNLSQRLSSCPKLPKRRQLVNWEMTSSSWWLKPTASKLKTPSWVVLSNTWRKIFTLWRKWHIFNLPTSLSSMLNVTSLARIGLNSRRKLRWSLSTRIYTSTRDKMHLSRPGSKTCRWTSRLILWNASWFVQLWRTMKSQRKFFCKSLTRLKSSTNLSMNLSIN